MSDERLHDDGTEQPPVGGRWLAWAGLIGGPLLFFVLRLAIAPAEVGVEGGLTATGRDVLAVAAWMAVWWLTEAVPLAVAALLPIAIFPIVGVAPIRQAAAPYADELIFLFLGGFLLGLALERVGLHKRMALWCLRVVGVGPKRMIGGVMLATAFLSMFVSNTATAMMMTPLALSIVALIESKTGGGAGGGEGSGGWSRACVSHFGTAMLLGVGYAASIGGMGTMIGTPPNLVMSGFVNTQLGVQMSFGQWMLVAMPLVIIILPLLWMMLTVVLHPVKARSIPGGREFVRGELGALGRLSRAEWTVAAIFGVAVVAWIFRQPLCDLFGLVKVSADGKTRTFLLSDTGVAIIAAILLFVIPVGLGNKGERSSVLHWQDAEKKLPWGVLLLFGGGLSVAEAIKTSGLDAWMGAQFAGLSGMPSWLVLLIVVGSVVLLSELAGNTPVATTVMPVLAAAAGPLKMDPILLLFAATMAASCGFALPVATPPNAIVFATGRISMGRMVRAGIGLDIMCVLVIVAVLVTIGPWLLRLAGL